MSADVAELRRGDQKTRRLDLVEGRGTVRRRRGDREKLAQFEQRLDRSFEALVRCIPDHPAIWAALEECYRLARGRGEAGGES